MSLEIAPRWKIEAILSMMKQVECNRLYIPGMNDMQSKTAMFMSLIGYTRTDVFEVLQTLEWVDYVQGPLRDNRGRPHDLWVFGKYVERFETYIKFTVFVSEGDYVGVCVSFHKAERPLVFPYKEVA